MVGPTRIRYRYRSHRQLPRRVWRSALCVNRRPCSKHFPEGSEPGPEDRPHFLIALQVDPTNLAGPVVEIEIASELVMLGFHFELRRCLLLWGCTAGAAAEARIRDRKSVV